MANSELLFMLLKEMAEKEVGKLRLEATVREEIHIWELRKSIRNLKKTAGRERKRGIKGKITPAISDESVRHCI